MKINRHSDILLNVVFPIILGYLIYLLSSVTKMPLLVKNYLPDGLWAYSFISALLIIWNREISVPWILLAFLLAACFELLQYYSWIAGTGDITDAIMCFIFFGAALLINKKMKTNYSTQPHYS
jgi:predicted membrane protein